VLASLVVGAGAGYLVARIYPAAHGAEHSCSAPAGGTVPTNVCVYPPNQGVHQAIFAAGGAALVCLIVLVIRNQVRSDHW
jgi:hypothetical protein